MKQDKLPLSTANGPLLRFWVHVLCSMLMLVLGIAAAHGQSEAYTIRFSDVSASDQALPSSPVAMPPAPDSTLVKANDWLRHHDWQRVWPKFIFGKQAGLFFAGSPTQRYLRLQADSAYAIWSRPLHLDPYQLPIFEITWGVERFPQEAALDVYGRNDRAIAVVVSFGSKVPSGGVRPDVPRGLAFFWGETETVGTAYTCIPPRQGPSDKSMQCVYPHVKYLALRHGGAGTIHTDQINLLDQFRRHFPDYWQQHQHVPPVVAVSFEVRSDRTDSLSIARLYAITFTAKPAPGGRTSQSGQEGR